MTAAVTQAVVAGRAHRRVRQHRKHRGEPRGVCRARRVASRHSRAARADHRREARAEHGLRRSICEIDGNFDDCMRLVQELGDDPSIYVANSINPFRIEGQKTVAFEMMRAVRLASSRIRSSCRAEIWATARRSARDSRRC